MEMQVINGPTESSEFIRNEKEVEVKMKIPKRVLHFSDGILEEYSDDDDEVDGKKDENRNTLLDEVNIRPGN